MNELEGGFSRRVVAWVVAVASLSFALAVGLSVVGESVERGPNAGANSFSHSALGHHALAQLLRRLGLGVVSRQSPGAVGIGPARPLVVAEPDTGWMLRSELHRLPALRREAEGAGAVLVLVLPKWSGRADEKRPGWLARAGLLSEDQVLAVLEAVDEEKAKGVRLQRAGGKKLTCEATWAGGKTRFQVDAPSLQLLRHGPSLIPVVGCRQGALIGRLVEPAGRRQGSAVLVVSDPDLLNNHGLGRGDHAALVVELLTRHLQATGVVVDETVHGFSQTRSLLAEAFRFPLVVPVLQGLILCGVFLWAGIGRFGKPLPSAASLSAGKEVLIDNTARLLAGGGHVADSLARYFRQTVRAVAGRYFLPTDLSDDELVARVDHLAAGRGVRTRLAPLGGRIQALGAGRGHSERGLRLARRLHRFYLEMTDGH